MGINIVELVPIFEDFTSILSKFMISSKFTRILDFFYCKSLRRSRTMAVFKKVVMPYAV